MQYESYIIYFYLDLEHDLRDSPIHVLAALLKEFLRNIPDSLLDCSRYEEWTQAIDTQGDEGKVHAISKYVFNKYFYN